MQMLIRARTRIHLVPRDISATDSPLAPSVVRRALKLSIAEGMFSTVHLTLTGGAFLTGFALLLGAGNITLGIVAALPFLIQPLQLLGAWLIERQGARKPLAVVGTLGRTLWLILLLLPYLPLSATQRLSLLILILLVSNALMAICANAWTNWMTDLVPPRLRGRYFSTRGTLAAAVAMVANYGAGQWLDRMRAAGDVTNGYAILFAIGVVCATIGTLFLARQPEPALPPVTRLRLTEVVRRPLRHHSFRQFMLATMVWNVALGVAVPFFSAHALTVLHLPFTQLAMFDVITGAVSLLSLSLWGQLADRFGHRRIMLGCMAGVILLPWCWVFATPSSLWFLYLNAVISGIWWPGINLAQANRLMEQAPVEARGAYLASFAACTGLAYFLASTFGGGVADALAGVHWALGGLSISNYQTLFIMSSLLRASTVIFWRRSL
ncbi:MAG: MFS transporter [Herpetosiphonaceae bacterium]|nr:MFS transporter [Herpetosiphonaceae bacterium]